MIIDDLKYHTITYHYLELREDNTSLYHSFIIIRITLLASIFTSVTLHKLPTITSDRLDPTQMKEKCHGGERIHNMYSHSMHFSSIHIGCTTRCTVHSSSWSINKIWNNRTGHIMFKNPFNYKLQFPIFWTIVYLQEVSSFFTQWVMQTIPLAACCLTMFDKWPPWARALGQIG